MTGKPDIDLAEVHRLVEALERDLRRIDQGEGDVATLREEVRALSEALDRTAHPRDVAVKLHAVHGQLDEIAATPIGRGTLKAAEYLARIGRMLGL
jgi:hypothetical protein